MRDFIASLFVVIGFISALSLTSCVNEEYIGEQKRIVNINIDKRDSLDTPITFSEKVEDSGDISEDTKEFDSGEDEKI